jgi:glycosyltransferase involved in cell wall biosynthesis
VAVVSPVYGNEATLARLAQRVEAALGRYRWRLRFVIDASPDDSLAAAVALAEADERIAVTALAENLGQHRALHRGLLDEPDAAAWVCLDADLQDPPEAIPALLERLAAGGVDAVFAGRRGDYEALGRRLAGRLHRAVLAQLTGLPSDAGAFVAMGPQARTAVLRLGGPSIVAAIGVSGLPVASIPVERPVRPGGSSAWTWPARARLSARTLAWVARLQLAERVGGRSSATAGFPVTNPEYVRVRDHRID